MVKSFNKFFLVAALAFLFPHIAFAAWWNPLSWFKNQAPIIQENAEQQSSSPVQSADSVDDSDVQERIIERVITVSDPKAQLQINQLIKENAELRIQLSSQASLAKQLTQCKLDLSTMKSLGTVSSTNEEDKFSQLDAELLPLVSEVLNNSEVITPNRFKAIVDRTNELIATYKYLDPKSPLKEIPDFLNFMSEGGQLSLKLKAVQPDLLKAYQELNKTLNWYISYR